jgi:transposase
MRYELSEFEWAAIKPMLPNKPRGVPRVNDRPQRHLLGPAFRRAVTHNRLCPELLTGLQPQQCCWQTADMTQTGSGHSSISRARRPIFRRSAIERNQFALALTCIARNLVERFFDKIK